MPLKACMSVMRMPQKAIMIKWSDRQLYRNLTEVDKKNVELLVSDKFITTTQMAILKDKSCQTIATRIKELQE